MKQGCEIRGVLINCSVWSYELVTKIQLVVIFPGQNLIEFYSCTNDLHRGIAEVSYFRSFPSSMYVAVFQVLIFVFNSRDHACFVWPVSTIPISSIYFLVSMGHWLFAVSVHANLKVFLIHVSSFRSLFAVILEPSGHHLTRHGVPSEFGS